MNIFLDEKTHEWVVTNNQLVLVTGKDEIKQIIKTRLLTILGEWYLDVDIGVPYFQEILVKNPNAANIEAIFVSVITKSPGVIELNNPLSLEFTSADRSLNVSFQANTIDGILDFNEVLAI